MLVRPYCEKDRENVQLICIKTSGFENADDKTKKQILSIYCDYYIDNEPESCFVLADEEDSAVGYIISSSHTKKYKELMGIYCKRAKPILSYLSVLPNILLSKKYPVHLHIDIDPKYQHKGYGSLLIKTLKEHHAKNGFKSLMLFVSADNKNAVSFYKRNGFIIKFNAIKSYMMTCKL